MIDTSFGTLLGGRVRYEQPLNGFRTALEPVLLAASVPLRPGESVVEAGTGAGAALICMASRVPSISGTGVELDPVMAEIARRNAAPWAGLRIRTGAIELQSDLTGFDHACANPPWHDPSGTRSPDPTRNLAKHALVDTWRTWCETLARLVRPGGSVTLVLPAARAGAVLAVLAGAGVAGGRVRRLVPKTGRASKIALVQARRDEVGQPKLLPDLILHGDQGGFTPWADAVLRDAAAIEWG